MRDVRRCYDCHQKKPDAYQRFVFGGHVLCDACTEARVENERNRTVLPFTTEESE